ncbi:NfeD family protein [Microvirga lotononidis]|uniref:Membrane protein implicated in regulation of membrane protease activity n=1 Tax=Microvirga lotononidis TaxID=864069 RepID=I4YTM1_9HYPH|nr:NfeD family protein [Microvirga lotononidis]EIM27313.1 membrane protein implicated in regulation of membrane protease activity [Microvirga lotononidis]WQO28515.1 NfeD family protein [Microvirga lotononidis]
MIANAFIGLGAWAWIILGVVLIGVELLAPGSFFLWLGLAAIVTGMLDALLGLSWQAAALLFALLAVGAVILGRYATRSKTQPDTAATALNQRGQSLIGRVFTLETPIKDGEGRIRVDDSSWRVIGADRFAGAKVRVVRVEGSTLVVDDP